MELLDTLLKKLYDGTATAGECHQLHGILQKDDYLKQRLEPAFFEMLEKRMQLLSEEKANALFRKIQTGKDLSEVQPVSLKEEKLKTPAKRIYWLAAAAVAGLVVFATQFTGYWGIRSYNEISALKSPISLMDTVSNTGLTTITRRMEDGSEITLSPQSRIIYASHFAGKDRSIYLTGMAIFKVAKDKARPFTVHAEGTATTALGTVFSVNTQSNHIRIELMQGSVVIRQEHSLQDTMTAKYLVPGQVLNIDKLTREYAITNGSLNRKYKDSAPAGRKYMQGKIEFRDEPLRDVLLKIGSLYNLPIEFNEEEIKDKTFTGTLYPKDHPQEVLAIICQMNDLVINTENDKLILSNKK